MTILQIELCSSISEPYVWLKPINGNSSPLLEQYKFLVNDKQDLFATLVCMKYGLGGSEVRLRFAIVEA